jgi:hypothetical protein
MKRLAIAATLLVALSVTTFAGEVPTMGKADPQPTPTPTQTTNTSSSTSTVSTILLTLISLGLVGR